MFQSSSFVFCKVEQNQIRKKQLYADHLPGWFYLSTPSQDPFVMSVSPHRGPKAGGTVLTITGRNLLTGRPSDLTVTVGRVSCHM